MKKKKNTNTNNQRIQIKDEEEFLKMKKRFRQLGFRNEYGLGYKKGFGFCINIKRRRYIDCQDENFNECEAELITFDELMSKEFEMKIKKIGILENL